VPALKFMTLHLLNVQLAPTLANPTCMQSRHCQVDTRTGVGACSDRRKTHGASICSRPRYSAVFVNAAKCAHQSLGQYIITNQDGPNVSPNPPPPLSSALHVVNETTACITDCTTLSAAVAEKLFNLYESCGLPGQSFEGPVTELSKLFSQHAAWHADFSIGGGKLQAPRLSCQTPPVLPLLFCSSVASIAPTPGPSCLLGPFGSPKQDFQIIRRREGR